MIKFIISFMMVMIGVANAANFQHIKGQGDAQDILLMTGEIVIGDSDKFLKLLKEYPTTKKVVLHNSPGGNYGESLVLSFIIKNNRMETYVLNGSKCVSACAFVWVGGIRRVLQDGGEILFHKPYRKNNEALPEELKLGLAWYVGVHGGNWRMYNDLLKKTDRNKLIRLTPLVAKYWGLQYWRIEK